MLLFPYFCAPVTPPPSPACSQEPDSEPEGGTQESYAEEARLPSRGHWGRVGAIPQGWAWSGQSKVQQAPQSRHRPPHPPTVAQAPSSASSQVAASFRSQSIRPTVLGRRPLLTQGPRRAKDRQFGTASAKDFEFRVNSQNERRLRSVEEPTPGLPVPRSLAIRGVPGRNLCPGKRNGKLSKSASASPEKYQGTCRRVTLEFKGVEKLR